MHSRVARNVGGVLDAPWKDDGDTSMHVFSFIDIHLSNTDTYVIGQFSLFILRLPLLPTE